MIIRFVLFSLISLVFIGCESTIETNINTSALQSGKEKTIMGDMYFEVGMCRDMEDSRKPSDFLIEARKTIQYAFQDLQYVECFEKNMVSLAHFKIPIDIGKNKDTNGNHIKIVSNKNIPLGIGIPYRLKERLEHIKSNSMEMDEINMKIKILLTNDGEETLYYKALSSYINNDPVILKNYSLHGQQRISIELSNVSVDTALKDGYSVVLVKP